MDPPMASHHKGCHTADTTIRENTDNGNSAASTHPPTTPSNSDQPFVCPMIGCSQRFKRSYTLRDHVNSHTGERPHVCPVPSCRRSFATSGNLACHKRKHPWLGQPLECLVDGYECRFSSEVKLERHMRSHFGNTMGRRCTVPTCGKVFSTPGNLRRHIRINHSDLRTQAGVPHAFRLAAPTLLPAYPCLPVPLMSVSISQAKAPSLVSDALVTPGAEPPGNNSLRKVIQWLFEGEEPSNKWSAESEICL